MSQPIAESFAPPAAGLARARRIALSFGALGLAASGVGIAVDRTQFFQSWLVAWVYVFGFAAGCLALLMLHHVTKGAWGDVIRRLLEAGALTLPLLALLGLPVLLGLRTLFPWSDPEVIAHDTVVAGKTAYLNRPFFVGRYLLYFAIWSALALTLVHWSRRQDASAKPALALRMQALSGGGILLYVLSASFASFDWLMSLDPHWFSSIYGIWFVGAHNLAALAFVVPVAATLARSEPMRGALRPSHLHDYGKLLLAFTMLWAYFSLSQFLIIWSGNLPEDIPWYLTRTQGIWRSVGQFLVFAHFALPFLLLLSTDLKRDRRRLCAVAILILVMRWVDIYWQAAPAMGIAAPHWLDLATTLALAGVWLAAFLTLLGRAPLLPPNEPFLEEALLHE
jgi:hypothetical protein